MSFSPFSRNSFPEEADEIRAFRSCFINQALPELPSGDQILWKKWDSIKKQAFAESYIWNLSSGKNYEELPADIFQYHPFGEDMPALKDLAGLPSSVVIFPSCSDSCAKFNFMYLFKDIERRGWPDHKRYLSADQILLDDVLVYLTCDFAPQMHKIDGDSWQLAYWLAIRSLDASFEKRTKLRSWLITGKVENDNVAPVKIGNKVTLMNRFHGKFMIPEKNASDVTGVDQQKIEPVNDVDQAWRIVTGIGFEKTEITLPEQVKELHILVGGSLNPVISVILLLAPEKVYLWCSQQSISAAEIIIKHLNGLPELQMQIEILIMDSHDLQQGYSELNEKLNAAKKETTVICNTGGNRLMGTAASLVARDLKIKVVYRDIDAPPDTLSVTEFFEGRINVDDIKINKCKIKSKINWGLLYSSDTKINAQSNLLL